MGFCERGSVCDRVMKPGYRVRTWSTGDNDSDLHRAYHNACQSLRLGVKIAADPDCSFKALPGSHFSRTHPPEERLLQWSMPDGDFRLVAFDTLLLRVPSQLFHGFLGMMENFAEGSGYRHSSSLTMAW
jgi:hypothetical protein